MIPLLLVLACQPDEGQTRRAPVGPGPTASTPATGSVQTSPDSDTGTPPDEPCGPDQALVGTVCMDRYEAPNAAGELPLVMYTFVEAQAWCAARGKRLCQDDLWEAVCGGPTEAAYPYGDSHDPGLCTDDRIWRVYDQSLLSAWPAAASTPEIETLQALLDRARALGATASADHVEALYQATPAAAATGCVGPDGVFDLVGNVEEWTERADGGATSFHGNLKGRYWAESRTCQGNVLVHGDGFRFYEIGFRCCSDPS